MIDGLNSLAVAWIIISVEILFFYLHSSGKPTVLERSKTKEWRAPICVIIVHKYSKALSSYLHSFYL